MMSWSINASGKVSDLGEALDAAFVEYAKHVVVADEAQQQFEIARSCALSIAAYGAVGEHKNLVVTLSGHANPGHEPASRSANDQVTVSVLQGNA